MKTNNKIKFIDKLYPRQKMAKWVDYHMKHPTFVLVDCNSWLSKTGFSDIRIAIRQCDINLVYDLETLRDELKSEKRFGVNK